jgi:hypothetical protein
MPSAKQLAAENVRLKKQATIYRLRLQGLEEAEIGSRIGVSQQEVSRCLLREQERRRRERDLTSQQMADREAEELALVKREAWRGWTRSLRDAVETTEQDGGQNSGAVTTRRKGQSGNPAHLAAVIRASERIARLYGLDAPPPARELTLTTEQGREPRVQVIVDETEDANRLRDEHVILIAPQQVQAIDPSPTPKAHKKASRVRKPKDPHQRVRGRPRGRKD